MLKRGIIGAGGASGAPILSVETPTGVVEWTGSAPLVLDAFGEYGVTALSDQTILVKMWGAGGACGYKYTESITSTSNQRPGAGSGYSEGDLLLTSGAQYVMQVGQGGARTTDTSDNGATYLAGGVKSSFGGTQGGGYTGLFLSSVSQANALLIAGGGGAGGDTQFDSSFGTGGGLTGGGFVDGNQSGTGGTQTAGGTKSTYSNATAGSALRGGTAANGTTASMGGGGGGYFGGGGGNVGGGGGGSGFVSTSSIITSGTTSNGSGSSPANAADPERGTSGNGGVPGTTSGSNGKIILSVA